MTEKRLALCVKTSSGARAGEKGEVVAALAVLGLVINDAIFDLHLADGEVALEVVGVVLGIPKTELDTAEGGDGRSRRPAIRNRQLPDFKALIERHKVAGVGLDAPKAGADHGVAHAMAAGVVLKFMPRGLPGWGPELF